MSLSVFDGDIKRGDGTWVRSFSRDGKQVHTRLSAMYNAVTQRGKAGGSFQRRWPAYQGVTVAEEFLDFDYFANWAVQQYGWGLGWDLDKDLLGCGSRQYHPKTCVFLPRDLNLLIASPRQKVPGNPYRLKDGRYRVRYNGVDIGVAESAVEAGEMWGEFRGLLVAMRAGDYKANLDPRAYQALIRQ